MDLNTILLIAFAAMMLFCCEPLGKLIRRGDHHTSHFNKDDPATADAAGSEKQAKAGHGGCCH